MKIVPVIVPSYCYPREMQKQIYRRVDISWIGHVTNTEVTVYHEPMMYSTETSKQMERFAGIQ